MTPGKKYPLVFLLILLSLVRADAQVLIKAYADKDAILVGEPIRVTVEARLPMGEKVKWFVLDSIPHFEFIEKGNQQDTNEVDGKKLAQTFTVTSYDTGYWSIPRFTINVGAGKYSTDTLGVLVRYSDGFNADEEYRDIKATEEVKVPFDRKKLYYIIGAIVLLAALLIYLFTRKKKSVADTVPVSKIPAYDAAMKAIASLREQTPKEPKEIKALYTSLNEILRNYLADEWKVSTKEKTNEELITQLRGFQLSDEEFSQLAQSLRLSDFVKFAKYLPVQSDNNKAIDVTESTIQQLHKTVQPLAV